MLVWLALFPSTLKAETSLLWYKTSVVYSLVFLMEGFYVVCGSFLGPGILVFRFPKQTPCCYDRHTSTEKSLT